ncbi:unnamed protein product [Strongylus vulgaris]|uniref:Uncharacterized protein n=1 Tax=Strongylus vulgaris TaxID=40348 RepID=A0A3P7J2P6_STRVU|nr:unnamed protein product [Strongylus vulgaris]
MQVQSWLVNSPLNYSRTTSNRCRTITQDTATRPNQRAQEASMTVLTKTSITPKK